MARVFTVSDGGFTIAGATTLVFVNPAAAPNLGLNFLRFWAIETGANPNIAQRIDIVTQVTAFPTLTSATPKNNNKADQSTSIIVGGTAGAAGTCGTNASAEGAGAKTPHHEDGFYLAGGFLHVPTPPELLHVPAGLASGVGLFLPAAPATLTGWCAGLSYQED